MSGSAGIEDATLAGLRFPDFSGLRDWASIPAFLLPWT